jgi:hypothetical protein
MHEVEGGKFWRCVRKEGRGREEKRRDETRGENSTYEYVYVCIV